MHPPSPARLEMHLASLHLTAWTGRVVSALFTPHLAKAKPIWYPICNQSLAKRVLEMVVPSSVDEHELQIVDGGVAHVDCFLQDNV